MNELFRKIAHRASMLVGTSSAFIVAVTVVLLWAFSGQFFGYSDTWQLVINTGTTILTFLMVFLVQNTQNRDGRAMQLKLDELIRSHKASRNQLIDLEELSDDELERVHEQFHRIHEKATKEKDHLIA